MLEFKIAPAKNKILHCLLIKLKLCSLDGGVLFPILHLINVLRKHCCKQVNPQTSNQTARRKRIFVLQQSKAELLSFFLGDIDNLKQQSIHLKDMLLFFQRVIPNPILGHMECLEKQEAGAAHFEHASNNSEKNPSYSTFQVHKLKRSPCYLSFKMVPDFLPPG